MTVRRPSENEEWVSNRVEGWVETYKKSMLTPVILSVISRHSQASVVEVAERVATETGWQVTERGLYRTLKRLEDSGLLVSTEVAAARTGAKRKQIQLTNLGTRFLAGVTANLVKLPTGETPGR